MSGLPWTGESCNSYPICGLPSCLYPLELTAISPKVEVGILTIARDKQCAIPASPLVEKS